MVCLGDADDEVAKLGVDGCLALEAVGDMRVLGAGPGGKYDEFRRWGSGGGGGGVCWRPVKGDDGRECLHEGEGVRARRGRFGRHGVV